jgi:hypothetical protein
MTPESICCSFEVAEELKKAGWNKETVFVWATEWDELNCLGPKIFWSGYLPPNKKELYPAPTAAEIELANETCVMKMFGNWWGLHTSPDDWRMGYFPHTDIKISPLELKDYVQFEAASEADVRGKMWLYLKNNGII